MWDRLRSGITLAKNWIVEPRNGKGAKTEKNAASFGEPQNDSNRETVMIRHLAGAAMILLLALATLCGCSKPPPFPLAVAQQFASADRVVLTNGTPSSHTFTDGEAQKIIRAVSAANPEKISKDQTPLCPSGSYLQFYRGTNLLIQMSGHDDHFRAPNGFFYSDRSGVLQSAWDAVHDAPK
jgi:hypothetical protein